ncbi:MAG: hypothetical protein EOQ28_28905 [Mesorhizobium sp.]|uniref:hypothetical protein n=1 Tax=Mesorhizobium sp. TaxID=1871066 RepID=UPI000FE8A607|nr:hypothetical protein [Mesorhizobium sp.]RWA65433.1 MAG: hypothetical protein EOQ28_28905 [Mesorhizobium sp.]RWB95332.1 MAG: hypothetical protein EOQ57_29765 [Mesorhizobium sp.]
MRHTGAGKVCHAMPVRLTTSWLRRDLRKHGEQKGVKIKRTHEKPVLAKREKLSSVTADVPTSQQVID